MKSIYTKSTLNKITRKNSFEYKLARNIACKYLEVHAVPWSSKDEKGKCIATGIAATTFHKDDEYSLKSFIHHYVNVLKIPVSFAKRYENLPIKSWT